MSQAVENALLIKEITPSESMFEAHLFNSTCFLLNKPFNVRGWQLMKGPRAMAQIYFFINNSEAVSGYQSTFGSFDVNNSITKEELLFFINELNQTLRSQGISKIHIRHSPSYAQWTHLIEKTLVIMGYVKKQSETNQHIVVTAAPFSSIIKRNVRKKINQCSTQGYSFNIEPLKSLPEIYDLVVATRKRKKYALSMTLDDLHSVMADCPNNYLLFTLRDGPVLIAASVSIILNATTLYNFYHADALEYRTKSPLSALVKSIYEYCQANGYKFLDLGISSLEGKINEGLFTFKENLGAVKSKKNTYSLLI